MLLNSNSVYYFFSAVILSNVIFGFISAVGGPLLPSIIIEFLGEENLAIGYGFLLIFEGLGSFVGPPLAGNKYMYNFIFIISNVHLLVFLKAQTVLDIFKSHFHLQINLVIHDLFQNYIHSYLFCSLLVVNFIISCVALFLIWFRFEYKYFCKII